MDNFSRRLDQVLNYLNITAYKMAKDIGTSESVISNVRSGKNKPSYDLLNKILDNYEVINAMWLVTGKGEMLRNPENQTSPVPSAGTDQSPKVNDERTIFALQKTIAAQEKTIEALERVIASNAPKKDAL